MIYQVTYDVSDDRIRMAIASILEGYGRRVRHSVFECRIDSDTAQSLGSRLAEALVSPENGGVRIYRVCGACLSESSAVGADVTDLDGSPCIIL